MNITEFQKKDPNYKKSYLKHACWERRCACREYGYPWSNLNKILANGPKEEAFMHTPNMCCPYREFILS